MFLLTTQLPLPGYYPKSLFSLQKYKKLTKKYTADIQFIISKWCFTNYTDFHL